MWGHVVCQPEGTITVQTFSYQKPAKRHGNSCSQQSQTTTLQPQQGQKWSYCRKGPHLKQSCPANQVICHKCNKKGHYSSVYHSKAVATVSEEQVENYSFLDTIHETRGTSWTAMREGLICSHETMMLLHGVSRAPQRNNNTDPQTLEKQSETELYIATVIFHLPASQQ